MSSEARTADALAEAAVREIESGMLVGLGTGRTAKRGIHALADRVKNENLKVQCVPTSNGSEALAKELGLELVDFALVEKIDYLFDGADEVDKLLRVLKGSGGAMTRERIVAWASDRVVYMVDEAKLVDRLGRNNTLAIAVLAFGLTAIRSELRAMGLIGVCRRDMNGDLFITDNGNLILDVTLEDDADLERISAALNDIPGVIDHGLFLYEADEVLVDRGGNIERMIRPEEDEEDAPPQG